MEYFADDRAADPDHRVRTRACFALRHACLAQKVNAIEAVVECCDDEDGFVRDAGTNVAMNSVREYNSPSLSSSLPPSLPPSPLWG